ncbi:hypothetical protein [Clostridium butyricum]|uniref:hypothetical protein n=1 Tax=Clostridium butyricum TaxID=1492 RepID=UPI0022DEB5D8|nr:hypothetical protein [Clostridium butyricum]
MLINDIKIENGNSNYLNILYKSLIGLSGCLAIVYLISKLNISWLNYEYYSIGEAVKTMVDNIFNHNYGNDYTLEYCLLRYIVATIIIITAASFFLKGAISASYLIYKTSKEKKLKSVLGVILLFALLIIVSYFFILNCGIILSIANEFFKVAIMIFLCFIIGTFMLGFWFI